MPALFGGALRPGVQHEGDRGGPRPPQERHGRGGRPQGTWHVPDRRERDQVLRFTPEITASPLLGEHTDEVLAELGYDAETIAKMHAEGVVV
jgi:hypothetical protein